MKRPRESEADGRADDIPESSRVRDVQHRSDGGMDDPLIECKHRIFLSHSGAQKDFVEILCEALENHGRFPFFDRRHSSLPKGESFPERILAAARQCQMGVVVVSEEYFMSKWPMIELDAFVQTRLKQEEQQSETKLKILPLFYKLSLAEFENEERRAAWYSKWEDLAKEDKRINISSWKDSLRQLKRFNGIEYHHNMSLMAYRDEIKDSICNEVPPDVKWDDSHVQGGAKLCQVIQEAISGIQPLKQYGVRVVGVYGVGGMGKTTLCKILCNKFCEKSHVKSSHVELGSKSSTELLKEVLKDLTNNDHDFVNGLIEDKCWDFLKATCKHKIFLAIDNVWPDPKSREEAKKYLKLGKEVHKESVVIVTSRALETLTSLGVSKKDCFAMPSLEKEDAEKLFLYHATSGNRVLNENDKHAIKKCIDLCYFSTGGHYLPLALKALGLQLGCIDKRPSEWVKALKEVKDFNPLKDEENPVFGILRTSFDSLKSTEQDLFMDLVVFTPMHSKVDEEGLSFGLMDWLAVVHNQSLQEIGNRVQRLKERGLVEDVDMGAQHVYMHDLYREFANLEASGKLKDLDFKKRKWAYYENSYPTECLKMMPSRGRWQNLTRFGIEEEWEEKPRRLERIKWSYLSDVVVLKLWCDGKHPGDLDLKGLRCLKSLDLVNVCPLDIRDGLQNLEHLVYFKWVFRNDVFLEKLPASLEVLLLEGSYRMFSLGSGVFDLCFNLAKLELRDCRAGNLDFRNCSSLQRLQLFDLHHPDLEACVSELSLDGLQDLSKLTVFRWKRRHFVDSWGSLDMWSPMWFNHRLQCQLPASLRVLRIVEDVSLRSDVFARCTKLRKVYLGLCRAESLDLRNCTSLESLEICNLYQSKEQSFIAVTEASLERLDDLTERDIGNPIKLPVSLEVLRAWSVRIPFVSGAFKLCVNLTKLELRNCVAGNYLDFRNCSSLESLEILGLHPISEGALVLSLDGLQDLRNLTVFRWKFYNVHDKVYSYELECQLPASLQVLEIYENVCLRSNVFARCTKLSELNLTSCHATSLNLRNCNALQRVGLEKVEGLRTLSGLSSSAATIEKLKVNGCDTLDRIPGLDQLVGLRDLRLRNLCSIRNLRLSKIGCLTNLEELYLDGTNVEHLEEDVPTLAAYWPRLKWGSLVNT
ncbi:hypothetical protein KC19_5G022200 [Ceratodon purpureus]|uniref:TIR domain-containing protein n=1 Tax=Ceratodon purpureus TaxID=3225 RepID=A0A8T0HYC7_CERPU|nr:hypothetical protein KC19_5G022200 [Ceratodon purpureus]